MPKLRSIKGLGTPRLVSEVEVWCCRGGVCVVRRKFGKTFPLSLFFSAFFFLCLCSPEKGRLFGWRVVKHIGGKVGLGIGAKMAMGSFFSGLVRMAFFCSRVRHGLTTRSNNRNIESPNICTNWTWVWFNCDSDCRKLWTEEGLIKSST